MAVRVLRVSEASRRFDLNYIADARPASNSRRFHHATAPCSLPFELSGADEALQGRSSADRRPLQPTVRSHRLLRQPTPPAHRSQRWCCPQRKPEPEQGSGKQCISGPLLT